MTHAIQRIRRLRLHPDQVRAIKEQRLYKIRMPMKQQPQDHMHVVDPVVGESGQVWFTDVEHGHEGDQCGLHIFALPPCMVGDIFNVTELWRPEGEGGYTYASDQEQFETAQWHSAKAMPHEAVRFSLEVVKVKATQLKAVKKNDAVGEGIEQVSNMGPLRSFGWRRYDTKQYTMRWEESYRSYWDMLYGRSTPWSNDLWTWLISVLPKMASRS